MKKILFLFLFFASFLSRSQQLYVSGDAILYISPGANLEVGGDLENDGTLLNTGSLSLYGNWNINNVFNGIEGNLFFSGRTGSKGFTTFFTDKLDDLESKWRSFFFGE